jgi:hypothetical protein
LPGRINDGSGFQPRQSLDGEARPAGDLSQGEAFVKAGGLQFGDERSQGEIERGGVGQLLRSEEFFERRLVTQ